MGCGGQSIERHSLDGLTRLLAADPQALLVAELDGVVAGSLIAAWDGWRGSFYRLAVSPEHRRKGLATMLLREGERTRFATAGFTLGGFGFSAYLTYRELFTLHKICEWCVSSAIIMTIMMCMSLWRFLRGGADLPARTAPTMQSAGAESAAPLGSAS